MCAALPAARITCWPSTKATPSAAVSSRNDRAHGPRDGSAHAPHTRLQLRLGRSRARRSATCIGRCSYIVVEPTARSRSRAWPPDPISSTYPRTGAPARTGSSRNSCGRWTGLCEARMHAVVRNSDPCAAGLALIFLRTTGLPLQTAVPIKDAQLAGGSHGLVTYLVHRRPRAHAGA
jgi:hypothetical protein